MATFDNIKGVLKRIPRVFAANAPAKYITNDPNFQLPEDNASPSTNNAASWNKGFPEVTFQPVPTTEHPEYTGISPSGGDINALGNALSRPLYTSQFGITPNFYRDDISAIGYPKNAIVWYVGSGANESVGQVQIRSKVDNNTQVPFVNGVLQSQWEYTYKSGLTIYPENQNIGGSIRCWTRVSPDGFIQQGGCYAKTNGISYGTVPLIIPYTKLHMGCSVVSVSQITRTGDNDPAWEMGVNAISSPWALENVLSSSSAIALYPLPLDHFSWTCFRIHGSNYDPVTVIWTSWGV